MRRPAEWDKNYTGVINHIVGAENASFGGCMFETYGKELEHIHNVAQSNPDHVWTIVDCDGKLRIIHGLHYVNRFGYLLSVEPVLPKHKEAEFR